MRIDSCSFGFLVIDGKTYTSDLIIYPEGSVVGSWRRKRGHQLSSGDIPALIKAAPEIIIAGTGVNGLVKPEKELEKFLSKQGITFIAKPNQKAMEVFNELSSEKKIGACFHLTC